MTNLLRISQAWAYKLDVFIRVLEGRYDPGMRSIPRDPLSGKAYRAAQCARDANRHLLSTTDTLLDALRV